MSRSAQKSQKVRLKLKKIRAINPDPVIEPDIDGGVPLPPATEPVMPINLAAAAETPLAACIKRWLVATNAQVGLKPRQQAEMADACRRKLKDKP
jgi:hypothetical protein